MFQRILVPTDGSPAVDAAVDAAGKLAERHDAELHTLHVVQTERVGGMPLETTWVGITDVIRTDAEAVVEAVRERIDSPDIPVTAEIVEGSPAREIVHYAETAGCDLVVMGTAGRNGLGRLLLGSVTEQVVRRSPVPVLTIRHQWETETGQEPADAPVGG